MRALRVLLVLDAAIFFWLGVAFIVFPGRMASAFGFGEVPAGVHYMIGMWGCVFATMAIGYAVAATDPIRHISWIQVGIARGALECLFGFIAVARGTVTFSQASFGIAVAALLVLLISAVPPELELRDSLRDSRLAQPIADTGLEALNTGLAWAGIDLQMLGLPTSAPASGLADYEDL